MRSRDRGSMLVLVVMAGLAITVAATLALAPMLGDLQDRQRARSAADAAALAGVTGGAASSERIATANGAIVVEWRRTDDEVVVRVVVGDATAVARATDRP